MKVTAILTVRNEGAFLIDWLAHHRAVGVSDFLVFSNDCDDGTAEMLDRLQELGWLTHLPNPGPWDEGPQWAALKQAERHPLLRKSDWAIAIDIDEFINIHVGNRTLSALLERHPQADAFPLTWRMFGNNGISEIADLPVFTRFTRAAPRVLHWPWRALMVKTLFRPDAFRKLGVHRPKGEKRPATWWNPRIGQRLFSEPGVDHYAEAQLNHYALGSCQDYIVKCDRGRANREGSAFDMSYWCDRNFDAEEDKSILDLDSNGLRMSLRSDPILGPLQAQAVAWRRQRFAELMAEEPWRALYGRLAMTPPARILTAQQAESIRSFRRI